MIKLEKFAGKNFRTAPEHLEGAFAQEAENVKLYSGDLQPYPVPIARTLLDGVFGDPIKTLCEVE